MLDQIIIIIVLIGINAFFATTEISIISLKEIQLEKRAGEGDKKSKKLLSIIKEPSELLATLQIGVTLASFFTSASAAIGISNTMKGLLDKTNVLFIREFSSNIALVITTISISFLFLLFGELIPKRIGLKRADAISYKVINIIVVINKIVKPVVKLLTFFTNSFVKLFFGQDEGSQNQITEEEIRMMINVGEEKGIFQKTETDMINSIFEFDDTTVNDVMTPRPDIIALDINSSFDETISVITKEKYSRIPVFRGTVDDVVGILYAKDIIDYMAYRSDKEFNLESFIKEPVFVTEYKKVDLLLKEMQKRSVHISIVIDEYGSTAGLVTIEDTLEVIVGKIYDEYDVKEEEVLIKGENEYDVDGKLSLEELNELLEVEFPDNYDTVSGLVLDSLGRFPRKGESVQIGEFIFTITDVQHRRIRRIFIKKNEEII
ncbi:MAG TPA: hemolysin family protein [Clostridiaceae bacterium]